MSKKTVKQMEYMEGLKKNLKKAIITYMAGMENNKDGKVYDQADFMAAVDKKMGLSTAWRKNKEESKKRAKNVSRWINGVAFPSVEVLIAISEVLEVSVNELFEGISRGKSKTESLSENSRKILKLLLNERRGEVSLYVPYAFDGVALHGCDRVFTRGEVVGMYKNLTEKKYQLSRMKDFFEVLGSAKKEIQEKYFPRFCNCCALENEEDEVERIVFDNTDACCEKLQKVWSKTNCKDIFNVLYFEETEFMNDEGVKNLGLSAMGGDKVAFYQNQAEMDQVYESSFRELLNAEIIQPQKDRICTFEDEPTIQIIEKRDKKFAYFVDVDGSSKGEYQLETMRFDFLVNLTKHEIKRFYQEELEKEFSEEE